MVLLHDFIIASFAGHTMHTLFSISIIMKFTIHMSIFTISATFQGLAWVSTKFTNRSLDHPDIEFHFVSGSPGSDGGRQIRKVSIIAVVTARCLLELSTVQCQSCLSKFILDKSTGSRSVLSLSSHSRFSLTRLTNYCPQGLCTLLTFSLRSCILLQWRDVTLLSTLVMRAVTHSFHLRDFTPHVTGTWHQ